MRLRRTPEGGFTLVEVMIALGILAIVLASLLAVFDAILHMSESSHNLSVATLDAEMIMEEALDHEYEDLLSYAPPEKENLRDQKVEVSITDEAGGALGFPPLPDIVQIEVKVSWSERGTPVSTRCKTLRARGF
jgi:prepilin-type N-terminal cleavage/methylation domain-containing protein